MMEIFQIPFMQNALIATVLIAILCSFLGTYIVYKRMVFVGAALTQICSAGIALASLIGMDMTLGSFIFSIIGVTIFSLYYGGTNITQESVMGIGYVVASALAILLLVKNPGGDADILNLLRGEILAVTSKEIYEVLILVLIIGAIHYLFFKEFTFISFDPIMARTLGFNSGFWNLLIYFTIGATVAFTVKIAGVLLVFSFFVIPTVTSAMLANRMRIIFILSMVFGVLSTVLGLYLAFILDYPAGPTIVAVSGMFLGIAFLIHKFRRF